MHQLGAKNVLIRTLLLYICIGLLGTACATNGSNAQTKAQPSQTDLVSSWIKQHAYPLANTEPGGKLSDLSPVNQIIGDARVIGIGEATHNSHEFSTIKQRIFEDLVQNKGFTTFALEAGWGAGLLLDDYVLYGKGNLKEIMHNEFGEGGDQSPWIWNTQEYMNLLEWMRSYNASPAHQQKLRFMGDDASYPGPVVYARVEGYLQQHFPALATKVEQLYQGLHQDSGTNVSSYLLEHMQKIPLAERQRQAEQAQQAYDLLRQQESSFKADAERQQYSWILQGAHIIAESAKLYSFDYTKPNQNAQGMLYRDSEMAENIAWWNKQTGGKILLSAHNDHIAYKSFIPKFYPKVQGAFLHDLLGKGYLNIGSSFFEGSFNALDASGKAAKPQVFTLGGARPDSYEGVLGKVNISNYLLDLHAAPPQVSSWFRQARPVYDIGAAYQAGQDYSTGSLGDSFDIVLHIQHVTPSHLL
ncbi:erythromycin esterase family protein [Ktedonosporobacter rubrisoli]|uniref:Erythromycin esterase family protein n=1 Tax=Ktedonosporobacter rubrisoli TaxID=2509675 RepID=A0A4P6JIG2_KTERU|nr:erythromycin esterase family protein [Ktedonosporobacter rubrisoli]QBD74857.1 erythromycin esterase family protein [Ktedonosporobacter rubrisoli]